MKQEVLESLRQSLEEGFTKQAGVLTDSHKEFINQTIENLEKEAGFADFLHGAGRFGTEKGGLRFANAAIDSAGKVVTPLLAGLGIAAAAKALSSISGGLQRRKFEQALQTAISRNPRLAEANQEKLKSFAETIYANAPNVSTDPNILNQVLTNAVHLESMDLQTIKMLAELESRRNQGTPLTPRNFSL